MTATKLYVFFRKEGFYPLELPNDDAAIADHVAANPGTIRVEDICGNVVWPTPTEARQ